MILAILSSPAAAAIICRIFSPPIPKLITFEASNAGRIDTRWPAPRALPTLSNPAAAAMACRIFSPSHSSRTRTRWVSATLCMSALSTTGNLTEGR
jgi:hypothetical protein